MPEHVQRSVHDESHDLFSCTDGVGTRVVGGDLGRDVDVAYHRVASRYTGEAEGDHVRGSAVSEVGAIQAADGHAIDERDGQQRVANPLGAEHRACHCRESLSCNR